MRERESGVRERESGVRESERVEVEVEENKRGFLKKKKKKKKEKKTRSLFHFWRSPLPSLSRAFPSFSVLFLVSLARDGGRGCRCSSRSGGRSSCNLQPKPLGQFGGALCQRSSGKQRLDERPRRGLPAAKLRRSGPVSGRVRQSRSDEHVGFIAGAGETKKRAVSKKTVFFFFRDRHPQREQATTEKTPSSRPPFPLGSRAFLFFSPRLQS